MIYITGDTHGDFLRFNTSAFPEQRQMTKDDCVIICGDFGGVWRRRANPDENYWLNWLSNEKSFTTLFVDGNHENFARLNSDEFEIVDFCGGTAQKIRENIFHLLRGQVYDIQGARFFAFGGASSHDIEDGMLDPAVFASEAAFKLEYRRWRKAGRMFRVKGESWWPEELPDASEMQAGIEALNAVDWVVDYVVSHCLPHDVAAVLSGCTFFPDRLTMYFNDLLHRGLRFKRWYCGHYHTDQTVMGKFSVLYRDILPIQ